MGGHNKIVGRFILTALLCASSQAAAGPTFGAGVSVAGESSNLDGTLLVDVAETNESFGFTPPLIMWRVWGTLEALQGRLMIDVSFRTPYEASRDDTAQDYKWGQLFLPSVGYERSYSFTDTFDAPFSGRIGIPVLFPGGDFQAEIDKLKPVGSLSGPRFGWLVGASGGFRKRFWKRFFVRGDVHLDYSQIYLFVTRANVNGNEYRKDWKMKTLRFAVGLSLEVEL